MMGFFHFLKGKKLIIFFLAHLVADDLLLRSSRCRTYHGVGLLHSRSQVVWNREVKVAVLAEPMSRNERDAPPLLRVLLLLLNRRHLFPSGYTQQIKKQKKKKKTTTTKTTRNSELVVKSRWPLSHFRSCLFLHLQLKNETTTLALKYES